MGCHTERLTLIRMRDAWRAVGAAGVGAGPHGNLILPEMTGPLQVLGLSLRFSAGEREGEGEGATGVTVRTQDRRPPFSPIVAL